MKTILQISSLVCGLILLSGCETTGLSSRERAGVSYPNYILSLQANSNATPTAVKLPIKLAVAQIGEVAPPQAMLEKLVSDKSLVASVMALPMPADEGNADRDKKYDYAGNLKNLCRLAQAAGAEQVFLLGGNIDTWTKNNAWSLLDWTIVGAYVVPGSRIHLEGRSAGVLIDVATSEPVIFVSVDAKKSALSPDALANGKSVDLRANMRNQLANDLAAVLLEKLKPIGGKN